jgi:8-oxo-dGTP pyrophosphatase MutT (NUDIX family)
MADYYNLGYREAVLFLFYKKGHILVEHRPAGDAKETFIPNGGIDEKDLKLEGGYRINAMRREVNEEFDNKIKLKKFISIGEFAVEEIKINFFGYLVLDWEGIMPEYTVEDGKKFAELEWINIEEHKKFLKFDSALFFVNKTLELMQNKQEVIKLMLGE